MSSNRPSKSRQPSESPSPTATHRLALFGAPPLIEGEDARQYHDLWAEISSAVEPADMVERIWVRDIVDLVWERIRLQRLKSAFLNASLHNDPPETLTRLLDGEPEELLDGWACQEPEAVKQVNDMLASAGVSMDAIMAEVLLDKIEAIERIEHRITIVETRRDAVLREIDRRRASVAGALRRAVQEVEDADYRLIETHSPEGSEPT